jgi:hypothetical protein
MTSVFLIGRGVQMKRLDSISLILVLLTVGACGGSTGGSSGSSQGPGPIVSSFTASPDNGYINVGESTTLQWNIADCDNCAVSMEARDGLNYADLVQSFPSLHAQGMLKVTPSRSTMTRYTITAKNRVGSNSKSKVVQLYCRNNQCQATGKLFFFKMKNSQSTVSPCFTVALYAADESSAKKMVETSYGGYSAETISEQEYQNGC